MPERTPKPPLIKRFWTWEKRKYIGVYLEKLNEELSEYFGLKEGTGLLVSRLTKDSPAEKAGMKIGDVIVKVDGVRVETVSGLSEIIQDKKKGDKIKLELIRDKKTMNVEVEVEEEEGGDFFDNPGEWDSYLESMNKYNKALQYQLKESQPRSAEEMAEGMKKLNEEFAKQYKDYGKTRSEAIRKLKKSIKYYSIYRV
jgi:C-terminal processing protease CtpA/Prc